jgi:signal transduction histidine kinase
MLPARRNSYPISRSLRAKVTLGVVVPLILILGAFTAIEYDRRQNAVFANLTFLATQTSKVIGNSLQHEMLTQDLAGLQHMLDAIGEDKTMQIVYLLDTSGRVVFAPEGKGVGLRLDNHDLTCQPCHRLPAAERPGSVVVTLSGGQRVFRSMNPIVNRSECQACHDRDEHLIGLLLTDISMAPLEEPLAADLRENLVWWAGTILVAVIVVNLAMSRLVIRRLGRVAGALVQFGEGQLDLRLPVDGPDEIGQLAAAFNDMGQRIQSDETENRVLSQNLQHESAQRRELVKRLITVQEEERRRVARDLHDDLGQDLAGLAVSLEAVDQWMEDQPQQARAQLRQTRILIAEATDRAYDMILTLRPSALDDLGLVPALRAHTARVLKDTGIQFEFEVHDFIRRLPPEIETALFRTYQEALSNVVRHARASAVRLSLALRDGHFEGNVEDNGRGFDLSSVRPNGHSARGLGLLGMQERIAQCGGTLEILARPDAGTRLRIRIPLSEITHA